jgi:tetratricopeptide (TPR) repeat protein
MQRSNGAKVTQRNLLTGKRGFSSLAFASRITVNLFLMSDDNSNHRDQPKDKPTATGLSSADYDAKLREIGNYLWDLEQEADFASAHGNQVKVDEIEAKILVQAQRAESFTVVAGDHRLLAAFVAGLGNRMVRRWEEATHHFLSILEVTPMNGEAWLELTWCLAELGQWAECEMAARKSTEIFPTAAASWGNLAMALNKLGKKEEAVRSIQHAIEIDPDDGRNHSIKQEIEANSMRGPDSIG